MKLRDIFEIIQIDEEEKYLAEAVWEFLEERPGNVKESAKWLRRRIHKVKGIDVPQHLVKRVRNEIWKEREKGKKISGAFRKERNKQLDKIEKKVQEAKKGEATVADIEKEIRPRDLGGMDNAPRHYRSQLPEPYHDGDKNNILVIGDIHEPFSLDEYLDHCRDVQERFNCGTIVFIGDVIDNHFSSYHEADPDGFTAGEELERAKARIKDWEYVFPHARVCIGNHDRMAYRKAFSSGVSKKWVRNMDEVLDTPGWDFKEYHEMFGMMFEHGDGTSGVTAAVRKAIERRKPVVQGHIHNEASVIYNESDRDRLYGMQVGCGIDRESYALAYTNNHPKGFATSCGVILNRGGLPIVVPMDMENK